MFKMNIWCINKMPRLFMYSHIYLLNIIGLVSLFNGRSTFMGYLMPQSSLNESNSGTIKSIAGVIRS